MILKDATKTGNKERGTSTVNKKMTIGTKPNLNPSPIRNFISNCLLFSIFHLPFATSSIGYVLITSNAISFISLFVAQEGKNYLIKRYRKNNKSARKAFLVHETQ